MRTKRPQCSFGLSAVLLIALAPITVVTAIACGPASASERSLSTPHTTIPTAINPGTSTSLLPRISAREVKEKLGSGVDITIVDVRSKAAFDKRHIVNAISIPLEELEVRYHELRKESEIITY